jgi:hypothetical protein
MNLRPDTVAGHLLGFGVMLILIAAVIAFLLFAFKRGVRKGGRTMIVAGAIIGAIWVVLYLINAIQTMDVIVRAMLIPGIALLAFIGWLIWHPLSGHFAAKRVAAANIAAVAERRRRAAPLWPPRKPEDWGMEIMIEHQRVLNMYRGSGQTPPPTPIIPSWEVAHRAEQDRDPLQIRWAQNDTGDWVKIVWGNRARPPSDGGPLPVCQLMQRTDTREWIWVNIGRDVDLDWQRGPQRIEPFLLDGPNGQPIEALRPVGSPAGKIDPAPLAPDGGHGDARFRGADDLEAGGFVPPR